MFEVLTRMRHAAHRLPALAAVLPCLLFGAVHPVHGQDLPEPLPERTRALESGRQVLGPDLLGYLARENLEPWIPVLIRLDRTLDLDALGVWMRSLDLDKLERRRTVQKALTLFHEQAQAPFLDRLEHLRSLGLIRSWRGFRISNQVLVSARPLAIRRMAAWEEVAEIEWSGRMHLFRGSQGVPNPRPVLPEGGARRTTSWGPAAIGAHAAWDLGFRGDGVVVGILDTGVNLDHEQLRDGWRSGPAGWFDPTGQYETPVDTDGHGSAVLSAAVARNVKGLEMGVAPGARWIAALSNPDDTVQRLYLLESAEWMLFQGEPDVLSFAFTIATGECNDDLLPAVQALRAGEIVCVFAAGNVGDRGETAPANYGGLYPGGRPALAVGALDKDLTPALLSSQGPSRCRASVFPSLAAPGLSLLSAAGRRKKGTVFEDGTSFATGLVAGAAALLIEKCPGDSAATIEARLMETARDLGPEGEDPYTGHGLVDLTRALAMPCEEPHPLQEEAR